MIMIILIFYSSHVIFNELNKVLFIYKKNTCTRTLALSFSSLVSHRGQAV